MGWKCCTQIKIRIDFPVTHPGEQVDSVKDAVPSPVPETQVVLPVRNYEVIVHRMELGTMYLVMMSLKRHGMSELANG